MKTLTEPVTVAHLKRASSSRRAFCAAGSPGSFGCASSPTTSAFSRTRPTRSTPRFAFPISCRTCSARARCRRLSSPSMRGSLARRPREADRVAGAVGALLALAVAVLVLIGVAGHAADDCRDRSGLPRREARTDDRARAHVVSRGGFARLLGVVPRGFEQSPSVPAVLRRAGDVERCVDRHARGFGGAYFATASGVAAGLGIGRRQRPAVAVQLPVVLRVAPDLRFAFDLTSDHVRSVARNFVPVLVSRGVVQVSAYIDALLASLLPTGAVTGLMNAQVLYTLPVSLFGVSVSAAELPAMSGAMEEEATGAEAIRRRLDSGLRQIAFFVVPSSLAFLALGDVVAASLLQTGRFLRSDAVYVWGILAGSAVGLLASTLAGCTRRRVTRCEIRERL